MAGNFLAGLGGIGQAFSEVASEQASLNRALSLLEKQQSFSQTEAEKSRAARAELEKDRLDTQKEQAQLSRDQQKFLILADQAIRGKQLTIQEQNFAQEHLDRQRKFGLLEQELTIKQEQVDLQEQRDIAAEARLDQPPTEQEIATTKLIQQQAQKLQRETILLKSKTFVDSQKLSLASLFAEQEESIRANVLKKDPIRTKRIKQIKNDTDKILGLISKEQSRLLKEGGDVSDDYFHAKAFILSDPEEWQDYLDNLPNDESKIKAGKVAASINPKKLKENRQTVANRIKEESRLALQKASSNKAFLDKFSGLKTVSKSAKAFLDELVGLRMGATEKLEKFITSESSFKDTTTSLFGNDFSGSGIQQIPEVELQPTFDQSQITGPTIPEQILQDPLQSILVQQEKDMQNLLGGRFNFRFGPTNIGSFQFPGTINEPAVPSAGQPFFPNPLFP